jgi:hypothetical protein
MLGLKLFLINNCFLRREDSVIIVDGLMAVAFVTGEAGAEIMLLL